MSMVQLQVRLTYAGSGDGARCGQERIVEGSRSRTKVGAVGRSCRELREISAKCCASLLCMQQVLVVKFQARGGSSAPDSRPAVAVDKHITDAS